MTSKIEQSLTQKLAAHFTKEELQYLREWAASQVQEKTREVRMKEIERIFP